VAVLDLDGYVADSGDGDGRVAVLDSDGYVAEGGDVKRHVRSADGYVEDTNNNQGLTHTLDVERYIQDAVVATLRDQPEIDSRASRRPSVYAGFGRGNGAAVGDLANDHGSDGDSGDCEPCESDRDGDGAHLASEALEQGSRAAHTAQMPPFYLEVGEDSSCRANLHADETRL
jgi:hypothetical protein